MKNVPIYLLSGFLGSGKTTLLTEMIEKAQEAGLVPAVLMNELGEVNLDGQLIKKDVAMAEVLGGCICCSMKGDLSLELNQLMKEYSPDLIIVESTGAAHPMESIDAITETSMYQHVHLKEVITVVDSGHVLARFKQTKDATFRLMKDQIACGSIVLINKVDVLEPEQLVELQQLLREWNLHATFITTDHCKLDDWSWLLENDQYEDSEHIESYALSYDANHDMKHEVDEHDHSHVMAYTHYWRNKPDSERFEQWLSQLPEQIYRAKGIVSFRDIPSRFLFQYAYKESDFMRIDPQGEVHDVAVFIGEHFDKKWLQDQLLLLEEA